VNDQHDSASQGILKKRHAEYQGGAGKERVFQGRTGRHGVGGDLYPGRVEWREKRGRRRRKGGSLKKKTKD